MDINTSLAIIFGLLNVVQIVYQCKETNRIKSKEECWNKDAQSIVNIVAKMQERIDRNEIQNAKELREGIMAIGAFANGMHVGLKEELKIKD